MNTMGETSQITLPRKRSLDDCNDYGAATVPANVQIDNDVKETDSGYVSQVSSVASSPDGLSKAWRGPGAPLEAIKKALLPLKRKSKLYSFDRTLSQEELGRFLDLKILLSRSLTEDLRNKKVIYRMIQVTPAVMGEDSSTARLFIVVACEKHVMHAARHFFKRKDIQQELQSSGQPRPAFETIVRELQLFSSEIDLPVFTSNHEVISLLGTRDANGIPIYVPLQHTWARATLGGNVVVAMPDSSTEEYGLTAGHFLSVTSRKVDSNAEPDGAACNEDSVQPATHLDVDSQEDQNYEDDSDEEYEIESIDAFPAEGRSNTTENPFPADLKESRDDLVIGMVSGISNEPIQCDDSAASTPAHGDWALIKLKSKNIQTEAKTQPKPESLRGISEFLSSGDHGRPALSKVDQLPPDQERLVCTARLTGLDDYGLLSGSSSSILNGIGREFEDIYIAKFAAAELSPGDSGLWVYDRFTHAVYGHIIGRGAFGEILVLPMHRILSEIKEALGASQVMLAKDSKEYNESTSLYADLSAEQSDEWSTNFCYQGTDCSSFSPDFGSNMLPHLDSGYSSMNPSPNVSNMDPLGPTLLRDLSPESEISDHGTPSDLFDYGDLDHTDDDNDGYDHSWLWPDGDVADTDNGDCSEATAPILMTKAAAREYCDESKPAADRGEPSMKKRKIDLDKLLNQ